MRDTIFSTPTEFVGPFRFGKQVVEVFDDMVVRSVPQYELLQDLLVHLALRCHEGRPIYDLGCSTGNTLLRLARKSPSPLALVGLDDSEPMLEVCRKKLAFSSERHTLHIEHADLETLERLPYDPAGAIILCLVLQFLRPARRPELLNLAYRHMAPGACLLVVEKTIEEHPLLNSMFVECYYDLKRQNGYSDVEIARKREALEGTLIPFLPEQNLEMLRTAGFRFPAIFWSWMNFQGYVAVKEQ